MKYELKVRYMQEVGSRSNQEDAIYPAPDNITNSARCFVLCDGVGGHDSGEVASNAVCRALGGYIDENFDETALFTADDFRTALQATYDYLDTCDTHENKKMATTMVFLALHAGGALVAHIGDSRVYHLRPGCGILFETHDHSLVNDLIRMGRLTEEAAKNFERRNVITRVMQPNTPRRFGADIRETGDVKAGDIFFLCSDGVNETLESKHIADILLDERWNDDEKMERIRQFTVNSRDNHTAIFVRVCAVIPSVDELPSMPVEKSVASYSRWCKFLLLLFLLSAIIAAVIAIVFL